VPSKATVCELKDHFSQGATDEIESVFVITVSNCAFVNYTTDAACTAAVKRFHGSNFMQSRLVCRARREPGSLHTSKSNQDKLDASQHKSPVVVEEEVEKVDEDIVDEPAPTRYFIMKSLSRDDVEQSVRDGYWVTQGHNEALLNKAFEV
jgi:hypothetical protein